MSGEDARWERALAPYDLDPGQLSQLLAVLRVIEADGHSPTSVRDPEEGLRRHVEDSLVALELEAIREAGSIADLGSGVGFPGLALAVGLPHVEVRLIESRGRRCEFLERVRSAARIGNVQVLCVRAEQWQEGRSANDALVARALAAQPVVLEYAAPLLRLGGALVDWRGRRSAEEEASAAIAAEILGLRLTEIRRVEPFEGARDRNLHVFVKIDETPERFPRRPGMAAKRPLGG
jgi:16S rRNA (guanine527-N7)-methyltransferase